MNRSMQESMIEPQGVEVIKNADPSGGVEESSNSKSWFSFWIALLVFALPMMIPYVSNIWRQERYRYVPFVLAAVTYLAYSRWDRKFLAPRGWLSWGMIAGGMFAVTAGALLRSPWLSAFGFVVLATTFLVASKGPEDSSLVSLAPPLLMILHLPLGYDQLLVIKLQRITTVLSSICLDLLTVPHAVANNVLQLPSRELFVAEACSGIQSVFTLLFLSSLLISIYRRPLWFLPFYVLVGVVLAVFANVIRVTMVALGDVWFNLDLAIGWQHEVVGYVALAIGIGLLFSFDRLIVFFLHPVEHGAISGTANPLIVVWNFFVGQPDGDSGEAVGPIGRAIGDAKHRGNSIWNRSWARYLILGATSLLACFTLFQAVNVQVFKKLFQPAEFVVFEFEKDLLDNRLSLFQPVNYEQSRGNDNPRLGQNADIWTCKSENLAGSSQMVLSQPFRGWHELCNCYVASDWLLLNREVRGGNQQASLLESVESSQEPEDHKTSYALARLKGQDGRYGYLMYSAITPEGLILEPPPRPGRLGMRFEEYFYALVAPEQNEMSDVMMIQMFVVSDTKLSREDVEQLTKSFNELRSTVHESVQSQIEARSSSANSQQDDLALQTQTHLTRPHELRPSDSASRRRGNRKG